MKILVCFYITSQSLNPYHTCFGATQINHSLAIMQISTNNRQNAIICYRLTSNKLHQSSFSDKVIKTIGILFFLTIIFTYSTCTDTRECVNEYLSGYSHMIRHTRTIDFTCKIEKCDLSEN